jgi:hypothetical protein
MIVYSGVIGYFVRYSILISLTKYTFFALMQKIKEKEISNEENCFSNYPVECFRVQPFASYPYRK